MGNESDKRVFSAAEKTGGAALLLALVPAFLEPVLAVFPLALFLLLCLVAPFFPSWSFFLPVISRGPAGTKGISLTFDDGPSPDSTPPLLELLDRHGLQATFFVVGEKAARHPELIADILKRGHTIGNHSFSHDYLLMLREARTLREDIRRTQSVLAESGITPLVFRPPAGAIGPRLKEVLAGEELVTVTYSCRALDRGNRNIRNLAARILRRLRAGRIIMLHDLPPRHEELTPSWLAELDRLFTVLTRDYRVVPLEELIGRPVMQRTGMNPPIDPVPPRHRPEYP